MMGEYDSLRFILIRRLYVSTWVARAIDINLKLYIIEGSLVYWNENQLIKDKIWCVADNHSHLYQICAKMFLDTNFN